LLLPALPDLEIFHPQIFSSGPAMNRSLDAEPSARERAAAGSRHSLASKFRCAFGGLKRGLYRERNFRIHSGIAALVVLAAAVLRVSVLEWGLLVLCIAAVLAAEMFNTAIESLARAVSSEYHADLKDALDMSSAGVLIAAFGAAIVGAAIFIYRLNLLPHW
jgi:diacylglycerol kinase